VRADARELSLLRKLLRSWSEFEDDHFREVCRALSRHGDLGARAIMEVLRRLVDESGVSAVVSTHDPLLIEMADRLVELRDGAVV